MANNNIKTADLIKIIGSPFAQSNHELLSEEVLVQVYEKAFYDRVAPLYLHKFRHKVWSPELERHYIFVRDRELMTLTVLSDLAENLNNWNENGYVIFIMVLVEERQLKPKQPSTLFVWPH